MKTPPLWLPASRTPTRFDIRPLADVLVEFGVSDLPEVYDAVLSALPDSAYVAGGFFMEMLAGFQRKDIDVWFTSEQAVATGLQSIRNAIEAAPLSAYGFREEVNPSTGTSTFIAPTKHPPISLNSSFVFEDVTHIIDSFDFTVVQAAVGRDRMVHLGPTTLEDIRNRRLVFHRPQNTLYYRTKRFLQKGLRPTREAWEVIVRQAPRLGAELQVFKNHAVAQEAYERSRAGLPVSPPPPSPVLEVVPESAPAPVGSVVPVEVPAPPVSVAPEALE